VARSPGQRAKFIVRDRYPEHRSSGMTFIVFEDGKIRDYVWDQENPRVVLLGTGKLVTTIQIVQG
jgi:hypothetical protein